MISLYSLSNLCHHPELRNCSVQAVRAGPQTDTIHFATWEAHTRGVGSKLMAAMGYRKGSCLGVRRDGSAVPIEVRSLDGDWTECIKILCNFLRIVISGKAMDHFL